MQVDADHCAGNDHSGRIALATRAGMKPTLENQSLGALPVPLSAYAVRFNKVLYGWPFSEEPY
jgi:hypothetical protein